MKKEINYKNLNLYYMLDHLTYIKLKDKENKSNFKKLNSLDDIIKQIDVLRHDKDINSTKDIIKHAIKNKNIAFFIGYNLDKLDKELKEICIYIKNFSQKKLKKIIRIKPYIMY